MQAPTLSPAKQTPGDGDWACFDGSLFINTVHEHSFFHHPYCTQSRIDDALFAGPGGDWGRREEAACGDDGRESRSDGYAQPCVDGWGGEEADEEREEFRGDHGA
jgi:hypothetical protein